MRLLLKTSIKETGGRVAWLGTKESKQILELNWYPRGYKHGGRSGLDHLGFEVKDTLVAYRKLTARRNGAIPPFKEGKWILAYIKDPDGNWVELGSRVRRRRGSSSV
jgi:catechol 2,3-dioxygenase-like lactoylglutathione lyase family enzyme